MKVVAVSGGFDPIHVGHIRLFRAARALGDKLVIILNNDNWLKTKKGFVFMQEDERKEIILALDMVDDVLITEHPPNCTDMSVGDALIKIKPDIFANGGDRKADDVDIPPREYTIGEELGIELVFNVGDEKAQSSSDLVKRAEAAKKN